MTPDEHQRERRAFWDGVCIALCPPPTPFPQMDADALLAERDKRFPAPSAAAPVEAAMPAEFAELVFLRHKARLWDAVATPQAIRLHQYADGPWFCTWMHGMQTKTTGAQESAAEAVEAAIAAGALK